jgi:tetratricopeptide (TPR) repeat protein
MEQQYRKVIKGVSIAVCSMLLLCNSTRAQQLTPDLPEHKWLQIAEDQYRNSHYELAPQAADKYLLSQNSFQDGVTAPTSMAMAQYFKTVSLLHTGKEGCEDSAKQFIQKNLHPAYNQRVAYALGHHYFQANKLTEAIPYYEMTGIEHQSNEEIADSKFELAYCYLNNKEFDKSNALLANIKEVPGKYYLSGNYYYGLLAYNSGKYEEALKSFKRTENEKAYSNIVPYYIAEIHYFAGDIPQALKYAKEQLAKPDKLYYDKELHLLIAQCYFEQKSYTDAIPYFEYYYDRTDKIRKEELYEMGCSYYHNQDWNKAISRLKPLSSEQDSLGQTAMYLLGDCYLKINDKKSARNAYSICSDMNYNPALRETALILNAKLSYEMGYKDDAMRCANLLLIDFPNTKYKNDGKRLLSELLLQTRQYEQAFDMLSEVPESDAGYKQLYQKVSYGYAVQLMQNGNLSKADSIFNLSMRNSSNTNYEAASCFWKAEIAYRLHQNAVAAAFAEKFLFFASTTRGYELISPAATMQHGYIIWGYAVMATGDYNKAQEYFNKAQFAEGADETANHNAKLREADAAFMQKSFTTALNLYQQAVAKNIDDSDYAKYQIAIIDGLLGKTQDKITMLQQIISKIPASYYANAAKFELADTYIEQEKYTPAIAILKQLVVLSTAASSAPKAWMKMGYAYQQQNNTNQAIEAYKHIISDYPQSTEKTAALDALKNLFIENNQPAMYGQLLKEYHLQSADSSALDSTYYAAAENQFAGGNFTQALPALEQYLSKFPQGAFTVKAHYYKGEIHYLQKDYGTALKDYEYVLKGKWNEFTESSALKAGNIAYRDSDYQHALQYYDKLRSTALGNENLNKAYSGLMKTSYELKMYDNTASYADTILTLPMPADAERMAAYLYKAKALQLSGKRNEAFNIYKQLEPVKNSSLATEARYHIAEIYLQENQLKEAEDAANISIKEAEGDDVWVVKSYLLLSDVLAAQKDYFNAKATLMSVIKNTKIAELKSAAQKKLEEVKKSEKQQSKLSEEK